MSAPDEKSGIFSLSERLAFIDALEQARRAARTRVHRVATRLSLSEQVRAAQAFVVAAEARPFAPAPAASPSPRISGWERFLQRVGLRRPALPPASTSTVMPSARPRGEQDEVAVREAQLSRLLKEYGPVQLEMAEHVARAIIDVPETEPSTPSVKRSRRLDP